jgi:hypothetical protein
MSAQRSRPSGRSAIIMLIIALGAALVGCVPTLGGNNQTPGTSTAAVKTSPTAGAASPSPSPGVLLGPQTCPTAVQSPSYWTTVVQLPPQSSITRVQCANLMGTPDLQALVDVTYQGTGHIMDVHVFTKITSAQPQQIFQLLGLYHGDAKISGYNTVITAEVDQNSAVNKGQPEASLQQDLFREFKWSDAQQTLVQVAFPAFFPDLTRYQAEADQAEVNQGQQPWKLNAVMVAQALAASQQLFNWGPAAPATLVSGGGQHDLDAVVTVKSPHRGGGSIQVSLARLEGNTNGGIWEVTAVTSPTLSITAPAALSRLQSPVTVSGKGEAFEGIIGTLKLFNHLYAQNGQAQVHGASGNGATTFSTSLSYSSDFKGGAQEGVLMLASLSAADGSIASGTLEKVLIV